MPWVNICRRQADGLPAISNTRSRFSLASHARPAGIYLMRVGESSVQEQGHIPAPQALPIRG